MIGAVVPTPEQPWPRVARLPAWHFPYWRTPHTEHLLAAECRLANVHCGVRPSDIEGPINGLIVGEGPGPNTSPHLPMFPWPARSAGGRLLAMAGMTPGQYLGRFRRINLLDTSDWYTIRARQRAKLVLEALQLDLAKRRAAAPDARPLRVLLLGVRVAHVFEVRANEPFKQIEMADHVFVAIPHPSGENRYYNIPGVRHNAGIAVRWAAGYLG